MLFCGCGAEFRINGYLLHCNTLAKVPKNAGKHFRSYCGAQMRFADLPIEESVETMRRWTRFLPKEPDYVEEEVPELDEFSSLLDRTEYESR